MGQNPTQEDSSDSTTTTQEDSSDGDGTTDADGATDGLADSVTGALATAGEFCSYEHWYQEFIITSYSENVTGLESR